MAVSFGQEPIQKQFSEFVKSGHIPQALMLSGSLGRGGLPLALYFAKLVLCEKNTNGEPCDVCSQCTKVEKLLHPDLNFSFPVIKHASKSRADSISDDFIVAWREMVQQKPFFTLHQWLEKLQADNKKPDINVKECTEIARKLTLKSFSGGSKVLILWLPEFLGKNENRLLKIVEEPPPNTHIVYITEDHNRLLATTNSRFQIINVPPLQEETIRTHLLKLGLDQKQALRLSHLSFGDLNTATDLIHDENRNLTDAVLEWLRYCYLHSAEGLVAYIEQFNNYSKAIQKQFFLYTLFILEEFIKIKLELSESISLSDEELEKLKGLSNVLNLENIQKISNIINDLLYFQDRNANLRIAMMADSLKIGAFLKI